jgi:hypothetical protein
MENKIINALKTTFIFIGAGLGIIVAWISGMVAFGIHIQCCQVA